MSHVFLEYLRDSKHFQPRAISVYAYNQTESILILEEHGSQVVISPNAMHTAYCKRVLRWRLESEAHTTKVFKRIVHTFSNIF